MGLGFTLSERRATICPHGQSLLPVNPKIAGSRASVVRQSYINLPQSEFIRQDKAQHKVTLQIYRNEALCMRRHASGSDDVLSQSCLSKNRQIQLTAGLTIVKKHLGAQKYINMTRG